MGQERKSALGDKLVNVLKGVKGQLGKMDNSTKQEINNIAQAIKEKIQGKNNTEGNLGQLGGFIQAAKETIQKLGKGK